MAGIYLHIPFCKQACHYCDFHFSTNMEVRNELLRLMAREIELQKEYLANELINTIYFGGGTPSLLTSDEIKKLLDTIYTLFKVNEDVEITLEANPDDLTSESLKAFSQAGINRLSIGIQSFEDRILKFLNRAHSAKAATDSVIFARDAGFTNISLDLIFAIPDQDEKEWATNIHQAIALAPEHVSAYSLTIEEKTTFGRWAARGKFKSVDDDSSAGQLEVLVQELEHAGYEQYEVSNFCKPGFQSNHNSSYWKGHPYLGIGPSAHSYNRLTRQFNVSNNHHYVRALKEDQIPFEREVLSVQDHVNEYLLTTLRTKWGTHLQKLKEEFEYDILARHPEFINDLLKNDLAVIEQNYLKLTRKGKLLADKISADLFLVS
jgi:oxygen-independent coproporphyrinogen-3 oxidase